MSQGRKRLKLQQRRAIRKRLDEHRNTAGLTRAALRDKIGCGDTTVTQWLNSKNPATPDVVSAIKLAELEGISLDWLLLGEGPRIREPLPASESLPNRIRAAVLKKLGYDIKAETDGLDKILPTGERLLQFLVDELEKLAPPPFRPDGFPVKGWWRLRLIERDMRHGSALSGVPSDKFDEELDRTLEVQEYLRRLQLEFDKLQSKSGPKGNQPLPPQIW